MPTLKYRRLRGDMIETFKIITCIYNNEVTEGIFDLDPNTRTRGHSKKIKKKFCKINLRKFSFTNRIVDLWNTLPQSVIDAMDVRQFEIRLDKYWEHQDVKFEYKARIQNKENTGNHTEISCIKEEVEMDIVAESQRPHIARNDRWFAYLHIQNGGSKIIWILTYSWTGNFLLAWAGQIAGIENQTMHRFEQYLKILQLYHENSRFPPSFKFWSVSTIQKHWEEVKKCILHGFQDLKALFLQSPF